MKSQIKQLKSEVEVIKWYMTTMEDGFDAKEIGQLYADLKGKHK